MMERTEKTEVCIVGGGPAGMILALDLAKNGIQVTLMEKNPDFAREFRGEVLQPRFMHVAAQMGLLPMIKATPHSEFSDIRLFIDGRERASVELSKIDSQFPFVTWMTQPDMLRSLADAAGKYPNFKIHFGAALQDLILDKGKCVGVRAIVEHEPLRIEASIVVGADGRFSKMRKLMNSELDYHWHDFDVMWFEMERPEVYTHGADFFITNDLTCLVLPKHPNKIQCGVLVEPGLARQEVKDGAKQLATKLKSVHAMFDSFADSLINFHSFSVLEAKIELVRKWAMDGAVLIGDAAHTCSPIGAIGVTIAAETAAVASSVIQHCVKKNDFSSSVLQKIQERRITEVMDVHRFQKRAGRLVTSHGAFKAFVKLFLPLAVKSGLAPGFMRRLISRSEPLSMNL